MMKTLQKVALGLGLGVGVGLLTLPLIAHAGRPCTGTAQSAQNLVRGLRLAERTAAALDASAARVVLLARAGQDLTKYALRYSHMGWAYKTPEGHWLVVHKLNQCGSDRAGLWQQGLGQFFLDDLWRHEAVWAIPTPPVQERLWALLQDRQRTLHLHEPRYSMVSYVWGLKYQQSNQWALETLASAMEPGSVHNRAQAQAWLQQQGYTPSALKIGPLTRLGGRMTHAHIAFDDHPNEKRFSDRIETVTVDSALQWLVRAQLAGAEQRLALPVP